jgi:predicted anti-sigma-YlaC factor YlaD
MTCRKLIELVTEYLEGALPDGDRAGIDEHLLKCDGCSAYLEQMRQTIAITGCLREDDLAPEAREKLLSVFHGWQAKKA